MKIQKIRDCRSGRTLYQGAFENLKQALEQAVRDRVSLDYAELSGTVLINAALDGARLAHARFANANLMGANLSEAVLDGADFSGSDLQNACFRSSSLRRCDFGDACFGATDIAGGNLRFSRFAGASALSLNFRDAADMEGCRYEDEAMTRPPLVILGMPWTVAFLDDAVMIGSRIHSYADIAACANDNRPFASPGDGDLHSFIREYKESLLPLIVSRSRIP